MSSSTSSVSPLLKIPFIQRILLFSSVNPKDVIHHALVHSSWRECLIDFRTLDWIWSKYLDPILKTKEEAENLKSIMRIMGMSVKLQHTIPEINASNYFTLLATLLATSDSHLWLMQYFVHWATTQLEPKGANADDHLVIPPYSKLLEIFKLETSSGFEDPGGRPAFPNFFHTAVLMEQTALKTFPRVYKHLLTDEDATRNPLGMACVKNCPETVKFLIAEAKVPLKLCPIHAAAKSNSTECIEVFCELAATNSTIEKAIRTSQDWRGGFVLHYATRNLNPEMTELILKVMKQQLPPETPLQLESSEECLRGRPQFENGSRKGSLVQLCLCSDLLEASRARKTFTDIAEQDVLARKVEAGAKCLSLLLKAGISADRFLRASPPHWEVRLPAQTPAQECCRIGNVPALKALIQEGNIDINEITFRGTCLHLAVANRASKSVNMLLRCGATRNITNDEKESPLATLFKKPHEEEYGNKKQGNQLQTQSYRSIISMLIPLPSNHSSSSNRVNNNNNKNDDEESLENTNHKIVRGQDDEFNSTHVQDSVVATILNETSYHTNSLFLAVKNKHHFAVGRMLDFLLEVQNRRKERGETMVTKQILSPARVKRLTEMIKEHGSVGTKHELLKKLKSF